MQLRFRGLIWLTGLWFLLIPWLVQAQSPLQDFSGKSRSIDEFTGKGKWTIVMIWASDCHVCNHEAHNYIDFHFVHSDKDATVLGISIDGQAGKANAEAFINRHQVNFPNLIGDAAAVADWFTGLTGAPWIGTPTFLIYAPDGVLKAQQVGAVPTAIIEDFMQKSSLASAEDKPNG